MKLATQTHVLKTLKSCSCEPRAPFDDKNQLNPQEEKENYDDDDGEGSLGNENVYLVTQTPLFLVETKIEIFRFFYLFLLVGVGAPSTTAEAGDDVDETTIVLHSSLRSSRLLLLLFLLVDFRRLAANLAGARQRSVYFSCKAN